MKWPLTGLLLNRQMPDSGKHGVRMVTTFYDFSVYFTCIYTHLGCIPTGMNQPVTFHVFLDLYSQ